MSETARPPVAFAFIFVTILLDMLALGIVIPVLPKLIVGFMDGDIARGAEIVGLFGTVWAAMQFLAMPAMGALSDRFGRRPVLLLANLGLGLDYLLMAWAPSLIWLLVGRIISGITAATITTAFAYVADVTPPAQRAARYGLLGAAFGGGFVLGPALGGVLGESDPRLPFWIAAGFSLLNAAWGLFILPESLDRAHRRPFHLIRANPLGALLWLKSQPALFRYAAIHFLGQLAHVALPSVFVLYATFRYGWGEGTIGLTLAGVGIAAMIVQGGLIRPIIARFGERRALLWGLGFGAAGFVIYGLAPRGWVFWLGVPVMALWGLGSAAVQAAATRQVGPDVQGRLQGALSSVQGVAGLLGPSLFTLSFAWAIAPARGISLPGLPLLVAALCLVVAVGIARAMPAHTDSPGGESAARPGE